MSDTPALTALLIRPADAARLLAISPRRLWAMTASGAIRCVRIGRAVRYRPADLAAFVDAQEGEQR